MKTKIKRVAITGTAFTNQHFAMDVEVENRWGLAWSKYALEGESDMFTLLFDVHPVTPDRTLPFGMDWMDYADQLVEYGDRLVTLQPSPMFPHAFVYPFNEVVAAVGRYYFLSSVAYMMGLAILQCYDEILLYGIDFSTDELRQLANLEYLCGVAAGRGTLVIADRSCDMLGNPYLYGYHYERQRAAKRRGDPHLLDMT